MYLTEMNIGSFWCFSEGFHGSGARCPTALIWDAGGEHVESAESSFLVGYEVYFSCGGIGAQAEILILAEHATESYSPSTQRRSRPLVPRKSSAPVKKLTELPLHLSQVGSFWWLRKKLHWR